MKKILFAYFILVSLVVQAQWTKYTDKNTSKYFSNNQINAIAIDHQGNKWFGTELGLTKFDGQNWTTFTTTNGLVKNIVNCITVDALGYLWIGTNGGISKYDGQYWANYTSKNVYSVAVDTKGYKWFATEEGILMFTGSSWYNYTYNYGLDYVRATAVAIDSIGNKWFGYDAFGGLRKMNNDTWNLYNDDILYFNRINSLAADSKGIWVGTNGGGALKIEGNKMTTYNSNLLSSNYVNCIAVNSDDSKWFGTSLGVAYCDKDGFWGIYNTTNSGLVSNTVNAIAIDKQKHIWFGTDIGASMYDGVNWKTYSNNDRLASGEVNDIEIDSEGNKWILSNDYVNGKSHLTKFDGSDWKYVDNSRLNSFVLDPRGNKWFGTSQLEGYNCKVLKFNDTQWITYLAPSEYPTTCYSIDNQGNKWFGTKGRILRFDDTNWKSYTTNDLNNLFIQDIFIDAIGNKWIGTAGGGVFNFDGINWINYNTKNSELLSDIVNTIAIDSKGVKWFGTDSGVSKLDGNKWTSYTGANGINFYNITNIGIDLKGTLWFSSIHYSDKSKSNILKFDGINWFDYSLIDSNINTNNIHSITSDVKGNIWFGTSDGVLLNDGVAKVLTISKNTLSIAALANSTKTFDISSNIAWTATSNQTWLTLSNASGSGNAIITLTATVNPTIESRTATVTVSGTGVTDQIITITQDGVAKVLTISKNTLSIASPVNSTITFDITSNINWTVASNQTWLTASSASGFGNATITLTAMVNPSTTTRAATVIISGSGITEQIITVTQNSGATVINNISNNPVLIFPNPVTNELIIEKKENIKNINFEILNSKGQIVYKGSLQEKIVVQTSSFTPGIFIVKLDNGQTFEFKKMIKE